MGIQSKLTGLRSAVGNMSGYRCVSDCRSRGREFNLGPVQYFRGDWSWNNFYGHSPPFRWFNHEGLLSVTSESMCTNYWLTACSSLPRKRVVRWTDRLAMTIAVDLGRKATKPTNQQSKSRLVIEYKNTISYRRTCLLRQTLYFKLHWIAANVNWNCLGQFREIPWNQTTDVYRGSTLIMQDIMWRWNYITWCWRHRNHVNIITSVIAAKQTA